MPAAITASRRRISWTDKQKQKRAVAEYLDALDAEAKRQAQAESDNGTDWGEADEKCASSAG